MSQTNESGIPQVHREYLLGVRIVTVDGADGNGTQYRFEAPDHRGVRFDDPDSAELYADVYFDVNGFQEEGTGDRGVPPEIIQAGRDTLAAYFLTQPYTDLNWVASFYGKRPPEIERYIETVRKRAEEIRTGAAGMGME
ncbi:hypothetical protein A4G99_06090 [Haladaptatus sp. R4]|uniref:hypothetical protein n=1 Tax=Haladaptatus sp. R4 TaxID=1679489 RepID=UPI0007B46036|nr:hypothetical protein [Haladaptatus sp. R4]KZN24038.1 hypothetical protein A4G99_06090 [Haladaptatus sp. R4]